jgi:ABC-type branched-subunit amino acid transport system ATPase component
MSALLELDDIHAAYELCRVLFGISLEVRKTGFPRRIACGACFSGS